MEWESLPIKDDPRLHPNTRGTLAFLQAGLNSRATRILLSLGNNPTLDRQGAAPFAKVVVGQEVLNMIRATGESKPYGPGPKPQRIQNVGNSYLAEQYPNIDYVRHIKILE
jgi:cyclophilin family peptidyl-prolyl cis-trans isomerase